MQVFPILRSNCQSKCCSYQKKTLYRPLKKLKLSEKIRRFGIREKHVMNSLLDMLVQEASYQMKNPGLRSTTADGKLHGFF